MTQIPAATFRRWTHSHEEDTADTRVYRPVEFEFPPARGRRGLELRPDGTFIRYDIAAADGTDEVVGRWTAEGAGRVSVDLPGQDPYTVSIISVDAEVLRVAREL